MLQTPDHNELPAATPTARPRIRFGLSAKLLLLTVLFVMLAEICIYAPSIANFRLSWLSNKLSAAHTAALVFDAAPDVPDSLSRQILDSIGAHTLAMKMGQQRRLLATTEVPTEVLQDVDIRDLRPLRAIMAAFETLLFAKDTDMLRAVGPAPMGGQFVEIVIPEGPLRKAMWVYSRNVMLLSLVISAISAALVYFALHYLFVRPLYRIASNMTAFRAAPEEASRILVPTCGAMRSASSNTNLPTCSATWPPCCSKRPALPRSGSRCPRSTTICATCSRPPNCFPIGWRVCRIRKCNASRPS